MRFLLDGGEGQRGASSNTGPVTHWKEKEAKSVVAISNFLCELGRYSGTRLDPSSPSSFNDPAGALGDSRAIIELIPFVSHSV